MDVSLIYDKLFFLQEEYNAKTNISRIRTKDDFLIKHIYDSLVLTPLLKEFQVKTLVDVGTGAGYPGIPLAIADPALKIFLNETSAKKIRYLNHVKNVLNLQNVVILAGRVEDIARLSENREKFGAATARALADLTVLLEYLSPLVEVGGHLFLLKGKDIENEITKADSAAKTLGLLLSDVRKYSLEGNGRSLLIYKKEKNCPKIYPRKAGMAIKRPLLRGAD